MPEDIVSAVDRYPGSVRPNVCGSVNEVNVTHQIDSVGRIEIGIVPAMEVDSIRWTCKTIDHHRCAKGHRWIEPRTVLAGHCCHVVERHPFVVRRVVRDRQQGKNRRRCQRDAGDRTRAESALDRGVRRHNRCAENENCCR